MHVNEVYEGDCLDVMRQFPDNCIDTIITDPPYSLSSIKRRFAKTSIDDDNLTGQAAKNGTHQYGRLSAGFMGKDWDNEIALNPEVWREALRVAKPGATLMAFGGTRTYHRLVCAIEDAGWEIRDCIMWIYGSGFPKSLDIGKAIDKANGAKREVVGYQVAQGNAKEKGAAGHYANGINSVTNQKEIVKNGWNITAPATPLAQQWDGWGTALKPAFEPIVCAMKPVEKNFAHNAAKWGVSGIWVDGGRIETEDNLNGGADSGNTPKLIKQVYGEYNKLKPDDYVQPKGRWPANVIHDSSPEVEAEFAKAGVRTSIGGMNPHKKPASIFAEENNRPYFNYQDTGTPSRFFYTAKASPSERRPYNNHPTVKPLSLLRYLAKLTKTPTGGIVLDPFGGSGTTGLACIPEGRDFILIEKEPEYAEICRRRIAEYTGQEIAVKEIEITENERTKQLSLW